MMSEPWPAPHADEHTAPVISFHHKFAVPNPPPGHPLLRRPNHSDPGRPPNVNVRGTTYPWHKPPVDPSGLIDRDWYGQARIDYALHTADAPHLRVPEGSTDPWAEDDATCAANRKAFMESFIWPAMIWYKDQRYATPDGSWKPNDIHGLVLWGRLLSHGGPWDGPYAWLYMLRFSPFKHYPQLNHHAFINVIRAPKNLTFDELVLDGFLLDPVRSTDPQRKDRVLFQLFVIITQRRSVGIIGYRPHDNRGIVGQIPLYAELYETPEEVGRRTQVVLSITRRYDDPEYEE